MEEAMQFVDSLAVRLKAPAAAIWEAYVRQAAVEGGVALVQYALLVALIVFWVRVPAPRLITKYQEEGYGNEIYMIWLVLGGVAFLVLVIAAVTSLDGTATRLLNPHFWAIQKLLGRI